jgi:hypothetical protein
MLRLMRFGTVCFSVTSVTLFAVACVAWIREERRTPASLKDLLRIDPPQISVGDLRAGSVIPVSFTLSNTSSRPIQVLGAEWCCTKWGCIQPVGLPVTALPHASRGVQLKLKAARAGDHEFSTVLNLYCDCPGQPTVSVRIQGRVLKDRGQR